ncbi:MAG TPA: hypothetical protein VJK30_03625 [Coxiellaceae bacterium]|nr:MAG: hypothetical protein A3E81_07130 [Gammaproteobacteria bacterium RIFCSPHIGHO2_12_FULL_36_30]HLB56401.1 hypothetical protein [Coxiellaceae bacterium]
MSRQQNFPTQWNETAINRLLALEKKIVNSEDEAVALETIDAARILFLKIAHQFSSRWAWAGYISRLPTDDNEKFLKAGLACLLMAQITLNAMGKKSHSYLRRNFNGAAFNFRQAGDIDRAKLIEEKVKVLEEQYRPS